MLKQRVITALIMLMVFMAALFSSESVFVTLVSAIFILACWEWAGLSGLKTRISRMIYTIVTASAGGWLIWGMHIVGDSELLRGLLIIACTWWVIALLWIQGYPSSAIIWGKSQVRQVMGWFVLLPAWVAAVYLRAEPNGAWLILAVVFIVAAADIGAYFSGRAFGRHKLAPRVSPGKSWEGVWGGLAFAVAVGLSLQLYFGGYQWFATLAVVVPTALVSVVGDLNESMVKRHRGVKDSSQLLPGHGGILDRVDGLVAAIPVFSLAMLASNWQL